MWLADGDPVKVDKFLEMPMVDYFHYLSVRIEKIKAAQKAAGSNGNAAG